MKRVSLEAMKNINKYDLYRLYYNFKYAVNLRKPKLFFRLVITFLKVIFLKKQILRYVDISVTTECNLRCKHCSAKHIKLSGSTALSIKDYKRIADQCLELGIITVAFQGGEPLLSKNIEQIISQFYPDRLMISIETNGTLLTHERILRLKSVGVDMMAISIDSFNPDEHDEFRQKKGAFAAAMEGIDLLLKNKMKVIVATVVTHQNIHSASFKQIIEYTRKKGIILVLSPATLSGAWLNNQDVLLNDNDWVYFEKIIQNNFHVRRDFHSNFFNYACGAAKEKIYITPAGDVIPCPFFQVSYGNVMEDPVSRIRRRMLKFDEFKEYNPKCLVAEDKEYMKSNLSRLSKYKNFPVNWRKYHS